MRGRLRSVLLFLLGWGVGAPVLAAGCVIGKLAELPVTMFELRPYVHARIEGSDVRLLADSGSVFGVLSPGTARELKLRTTPAPFGFLLKGIGGTTDAAFVTVKDFRLDAIPLHNVGFIVGGSEIGPGMGGLLGRNLLNYADTEYDLANGTIRLMRPSGCGGRALAYWGADKALGEAEMLPSDQRFPATIIPVEVNGVKLKATLDTGAATSVLTLSAATRVGISNSGSQTVPQAQGAGIGRRTVRAFIGPLGDFMVGGEEIKNTHVWVMDTNLYESDMLLGADFFLSHRVFVANSQRKVYFTYNGGPVFSLVAKGLDTAAPTDSPSAAAADPTPGEAEPKDAAGFSRRGEASASRKDYPHALADLDRAVAMAPTEPDYLYQRAVIHLQGGQQFLAMSDLDQTLKLRPTDTSSRLLRAQLRIAGHDTGGALADLDEITRAASPAADVRFAVGQIYGRIERYDQSLEQYGLWLAAHPDDHRAVQAFNGRCWARAALNRDLDKALSDCNRGLRLNPKDATLLDSRGLVHLRQGAFDLAIADYDAALALNGKQAWSFYGRGVAKMRKGDAAGGKADIAAATAINPKIVEVATKIGVKPEAP